MYCLGIVDQWEEFVKIIHQKLSMHGPEMLLLYLCLLT